MEEGRIRWYMVRLKGFEAVDAAYELLLLICLNRAERERFKLTQKPLSPWFVSMLIDSGFFAVEEKEEFPWKINLVVDARRVVRAAVSKVGEEYKLVNPIQKPKPAEANAPKPTN